MGGSFSLENYSVDDLREVVDMLQVSLRRWDGSDAAVRGEIDNHSSMPQAPSNEQRAAIIDAVRRSWLSEVCAACEDAGLDYSAIAKVEKRLLFDRTYRTIRESTFRSVTLTMLMRRLETDVSTPTPRTKHEVWDHVKTKLSIYAAPGAGTWCCADDRTVAATSVGPEMTPDVSKISPALWVELERAFEADCNMSVWPESTKALFLTDVESIMFDANESVAPDDPNKPRKPVAAKSTPKDNGSPEATSVLTRQLMPCNFKVAGFTLCRCRYCDSAWPSSTLRTRHEGDCRENPGGRFRAELDVTTGAVADASEIHACKHCGKVFAGKASEDHESHCLANPHGREDARPTPTILSCEHCGRTFQTHRGCGSHKGHCRKNPRRRGVPLSTTPVISTTTKDACEPFSTMPTYSCRCGRRFLAADHCVAHKRQCHIELVAISLRLRNSSPTEAARLRSTPLARPSPNPGEAERLRADVIQAVWDHEVLQAWCSVDWGDSSRAILCHLLWRNIDFAVKHGWVNWPMRQNFLAQSGAPSEYTAVEKWQYVLGELSQQTPAAAEEQWRTWLERASK